MTDQDSPLVPANEAAAASDEEQPTGVVQLPTPFVVIATPSLKHECSMWHRQSVIAVTVALMQRGVPHVFVPVNGVTYLDRARDLAATQFLEDYPQATDLFFWDDDVGGEDLVTPFFQFLIRPEPILIGATPLKNDDRPEGPSFPVRFLADENGHLLANSGLMRVDRGPAGFMRIKRQVLEHLIAADKAVSYREPHSRRMIRHFFSCGVGADDDGTLTYWGEDTVFIARCALAGIETWLEPNITFRHDGRKSYVGNCLRELFRQHGHELMPDGLAPTRVEASASEDPMKEYPKMVRGTVATDAEDESRIEREWLAANPAAEPVEVAATTNAWNEPPAPPGGASPDGVSSSSPIVDLSLLPVYQAESLAEQVESPKPTGIEPDGVWATVTAADAPPETAPGPDEVANSPKEIPAAVGEEGIAPHHVDSRMAGLTVEPVEPVEVTPVAAAPVEAPAAEEPPPALQAIESTEAAGEAQPAVITEPAQPAEPAIDAGAAAEPVDAPEPISAPTPAAEVEQPAAAAAPALADTGNDTGNRVGPEAEEPAEAPVDQTVQQTGNETAPVEQEQAPIEQEQAAVAAAAAASPGAADTEGAAAGPDAGSATAEAQPDAPAPDAQPAGSN